MSRITLRIARERIVYRSGQTNWTGFTANGTAIARNLDRLVPIVSRPSIPSLTAYLVDQVQALIDDDSIPIEIVSVEIDDTEGDVPRSADA